METTRRIPARTLLKFQSEGFSDRGKIRSINEDAWLDRKDIGLWVVADGAGGHGMGDYASNLIIDSLDKVALPSSATSFLTEVNNRLIDVNRILRSTASGIGPNRIIATTVVALLIFGRHFACVWAGDSRLYRLRNGQFSRVTRDHSHVQELIDSGLLEPAQADQHPQSNIITRAVGACDELLLDQLQGAVAAGDLFLLCSDGLTKMLTDEEIAAILMSEPVCDAPRKLVEATLDHGAFDNVTAVAVQCQSGGTARR